MSAISSLSACSDSENEFSTAVLKTLSDSPKSIPCRFLYDSMGSELFERITQLEEYYLTRTEIALLNSISKEIADRVGAGVALVEFGSGSSTKTTILIDYLKDLAAYVPIEISPAAVKEATTKLKHAYPWLKIIPVHADFSQDIELGGELSTIPKLGFFPGSTIGNFDKDQAVDFLKRAGKILGPGSKMLVGADLDKNEDVLLRAYDDAKGVTAEFILNILQRINRELGANFDSSKFAYEAIYNPVLSRVEMYIVSLRKQTVSICGKQISFQTGERIHVENSHKYSIESFKSIASTAGWRTTEYWVDDNNLFSMHLLQNHQ